MTFMCWTTAAVTSNLSHRVFRNMSSLTTIRFIHKSNTNKHKPCVISTQMVSLIINYEPICLCIFCAEYKWLLRNSSIYSFVWVRVLMHHIFNPASGNTSALLPSSGFVLLQSRPPRFKALTSSYWPSLHEILLHSSINQSEYYWGFHVPNARCQ